MAGTWMPASERQAEQACAELARTTSNPKLGPGQSRVYRSARSLDGFAARRPADMPTTVTPPSARHETDGTWTAELWLIEPAQIQQYSCRVRTDSITVTKGESVTGGAIPAE